MRKLTVIVVLLLVAGGLVAPPRAEANSYGRLCHQFFTETNAEATVCAFIDNQRFNGGFRGAGTMEVDRGVATMAIKSVSLTLDGKEIAQAGRSEVQGKKKVEQKTDFVKRRYGQYRVYITYEIAEGDGWTSSGHSSHTYDYYYDDSPGNPA